jgi:hypothetical protein
MSIFAVLNQFRAALGRRDAGSATLQVDDVFDDDDPVARKSTWDDTVNQSPLAAYF